MTRHQRRKLAKAKAVAKQRQAIVRRNLSTPVDRMQLRGRLVSGVYGNEMDRARGMGVVPMTHKVQRTISSVPYVNALGAHAPDTGSRWKV